MKTALLEIEATLSNAIAQMSAANPSAEKAIRGIEVARKKLLDLAESQSDRDSLLDADWFLFISVWQTANSVTPMPSCSPSFPRNTPCEPRWNRPGKTTERCRYGKSEEGPPVIELWPLAFLFFFARPPTCVADTPPTDDADVSSLGR